MLAFIQYVKPRMKSPASIRNLIGSLSTAFKRADLDATVFSAFKVQNALRSIEINSRYRPDPKLPINPEQLDQVIGRMRRDRHDPSIICAIAFAFTGLFRQSNLAPTLESKFDPTRHMTRRDIVRANQGLEVTIKWSKTIQRTQDATTITLPRISGREFCPVVAYDALTLSNPLKRDSAPLFATREGRPLSLGLLKRAWKETLVDLALPHERLSLHSLRSGGATAAWDTGKVSETDLKKHGTWSSSAWMGYVRTPYHRSTVITAFKGMSK